MNHRRLAVALFTLLAWAALSSPAFAQQRPLTTEDPEPIGAGRVLLARVGDGQPVVGDPAE